MMTTHDLTPYLCDDIRTECFIELGRLRPNVRIEEISVFLDPQQCEGPLAGAYRITFRGAETLTWLGDDQSTSARILHERVT